jgi:hypothetical protein
MIKFSNVTNAKVTGSSHKIKSSKLNGRDPAIDIRITLKLTSVKMGCEWVYKLHSINGFMRLHRCQYRPPISKLNTKLNMYK